jgi:hypothetical protein
LIEKCINIDKQFFPALFEFCRLCIIMDKSNEITQDIKSHIDKNLTSYPSCNFDYSIFLLNMPPNLKGNKVFYKLKFLGPRKEQCFISFCNSQWRHKYKFA